LSLQEVAAALGVHYMTVYRYVRLGHLPATKVGSTWRVEATDLASFRSGVEPAGGDAPAGPAVSGRDRRRHVNWAERYETRIVAGDRLGSWAVVEACLVSGRDIEDLYLDVVAPALASIGERWAAGQLSIADEHRASTIVRQHLGRLSPRLGRRGRSRGEVLIGAAPGDRHDLGVAMVGDLLRQAGFDAVDLGADVPVESFVEVARSLGRLVAVAVGVGTDDHRAAAAEVVVALREVLPSVAILCGGPGLPDAAAASALGAHGWVPDARAAVSWVESAAPRTA